MGRRLSDHDYLVRSRMDAIFKDLLREPHDKILDIGCGSRPYRSLLRGSVGIDYNSGDIHAVGESLPIKSESIDLVFSTQVLEHVDDPAKFLSEAYRVLKPGGHLILSTHGTYPIHAERDFWRWTEAGLRRLFSEFREVKVIPVGGYWLCLCQLAAWFLRGSPVSFLIPLINLIGSHELIKNDKLVCVYVIVGKR